MPSFFDPSFGMNNPFYTKVSLYTIVFIKKKPRVTSSPVFFLNCPHLFHPPPFTGNPVDVIIPRHVNKVRHGFSSRKRVGRGTDREDHWGIWVGAESLKRKGMLTRLVTWLLQSRVDGQGLYLRLLDFLGRSCGANDHINKKPNLSQTGGPEQWTGPTDQPYQQTNGRTNRPAKRGVVL